MRCRCSSVSTWAVSSSTLFMRLLMMSCRASMAGLRFEPGFVTIRTRRSGYRSRSIGATRPRDVFARNQCAVQCARCVCEMREMIQETRQSFAMAAE